MSCRATPVVQKVYFHVTKIITWFGMEEVNWLYSLPVPGTCWSKNGSKMVLQTLELHFETQFIIDREWMGAQNTNTKERDESVSDRKKY